MSHDPMAARLAMLRRAGGDKLIRDLIDLVCENAPHRLAAARAALAAGDADGVGRAAHALMGSAANLGAAEMQRDAADLERDAAKGHDLAEPLRRLEESWERARDLLAEVRRGLTP